MKESDRKIVTLIGKSGSFTEVVAKIPFFAQSYAPLYISGETGVGKDILAREVHAHSPRKDGPFTLVQCGTLPDHLAENELFGHAKGAYTDATVAKNGLIAETEGGTLFLDEVDTLSPASQIKLLHFIETHEYYSLGSPKMQTANVRIISASNVDLLKQVELHQFRSDLYYRLHVLVASIPPLRERVDDIPLLATHFLEKYGYEYHRLPLTLDKTVIDKMMAYSWPGNIRELAGVMECAVLMTTASILNAEDIPISQAREVRHIGSLKEAVTCFEREYIISILNDHYGNVSHCARVAGVQRQAFQQLLRKHRIDRTIYQKQTPTP